MLLESTIFIGDDSDCETCGPSYNHIRYSFDTDTDSHMVQTQIGCYGGETVEVKLPGEVVNLLAPYRDWPGGADVYELIRWLVNG